jgi:magnesium transporter
MHEMPDSITNAVDETFKLVKDADFDQARRVLLTLHPADIADILDQICDYDSIEEFFTLLTPELPAEVIPALSSSTVLKLLSAIGTQEFTKFLEKLDLTDAIEVVGQFSPSIRAEVLEYCPRERSKEIAIGLSYLSDTVGRVMDHDVASVLPSWSVKTVIDSLLKKTNKKNLHSIIVSDQKYRPIGVVGLADLLRAEPEKKISEILKSDVQILAADADLGQLSYVFKQYSPDVVAVVNKLGKLVGSVSISDVINIVATEVEEDVMHLGGVRQKDQFGSFLNIIKHRFLWLCLNLIISGIGYSLVVNRFSDTIVRVVAVAAIAPIVASMSGNAGTQVITVTVLAIASSGASSRRSLLRLANRELLVAFFNGLLLAPVGGLFLWFIYKDIGLSLIFGIALAINCFLAGVFGCAVPMAFKLCGIDPASSSGVVVTNLTDSLSHLSMLALAFYFLT